MEIFDETTKTQSKNSHLTMSFIKVVYLRLFKRSKLTFLHKICEVTFCPRAGRKLSQRIYPWDEKSRCILNQNMFHIIPTSNVIVLLSSKRVKDVPETLHPVSIETLHPNYKPMKKSCYKITKSKVYSTLSRCFN